MIRHFAALKLRLLRNGLRGRRGRVLILAVAPLFAIAVVAPVFGLLAGLRGDPDAAATLTIVFGAVWVGWSVLPIAGFGSDETLDPANLALLPLTPEQLAAGLLTASAVGLAPLGTAAALLGAAFGFGSSVFAVAVALVAIVVEVAACLVSSRLLVTGLSGLLRSRRGRDVAVTFGALIGVGVQLLRFAVFDRQGRLRTGAFTAVQPWLRWTPPGLAAQAISSANRGHGIVAVLALFGATAEVAVLVASWTRVLGRVATSPETATQRRAIRAGESLAPLPRFVPRTRTGIVAMKDLRYLARDPRRRAAIIPAIILPVVPILSVLRAGGGSPELVVAGAFASVFAGIVLCNNQFGPDGPAYWLHVAADGGAREDVAGKNVAALIVSAPIPVLATGVLALATRSAAWVPFTLVLAAGVVATLLGVGSYVSVLLPQPLPESRTNMWAARSGQGCVFALISLAVLAAEVVVLVPVIAGAVIVATSAPHLAFTVAVGAVLYGGAIWVTGVHLASRRLERRQPEMLARLAPRLT